jgi:hypothetical protein
VTVPQQYQGAAEVRLRTGPYGESRDSDSGPRRLHAVFPCNLTPLCGGRQPPLLPTFASWTSAVQPGVHLCERCVSLSPAGPTPTPTPHLGGQLLADATPARWTYLWRPFAQWRAFVVMGAMAVFFVVVTIVALTSADKSIASRLGMAVVPLIFALTIGLLIWRLLVIRCSVGPDGLTVVGLFGTYALSWGDVVRFDARSGSRGATVVVIRRNGATLAIRLPSSVGLPEAQWRASVLNWILGLGVYPA